MCIGTVQRNVSAQCAQAQQRAEAINQLWGQGWRFESCGDSVGTEDIDQSINGPTLSSGWLNSGCDVKSRVEGIAFENGWSWSMSRPPAEFEHRSNVSSSMLSSSANRLWSTHPGFVNSYESCGRQLAGHREPTISTQEISELKKGRMMVADSGSPYRRHTSDLLRKIDSLLTFSGTASKPSPGAKKVKKSRAKAQSVWKPRARNVILKELVDLFRHIEQDRQALVLCPCGLPSTDISNHPTTQIDAGVYTKLLPSRSSDDVKWDPSADVFLSRWVARVSPTPSFAEAAPSPEPGVELVDEWGFDWDSPTVPPGPSVRGHRGACCGDASRMPEYDERNNILDLLALLNKSGASNASASPPPGPHTFQRDISPQSSATFCPEIELRN